ncbi:divalent cation tolerance protein [Mariprofundus ferrinatatus]|uniref:Divalent cation tolerance protein n=1 Tax=Mariprofundus ferrinatatus TaxID=1921087 RepID=A0A2K8L557_9PROT|nr:divalent-cation tolerance protein CutA [Mariprofundus ferrinatatus]ATX80981.1 divalent cation tolerance protein [Mariprofundus ferrinatatus]
MLKICLIKTSINSKSAARRLAERLVETKLAACIQISKGRSVYRWQGKLEKEREYFLAIKTAPSLCERVIAQLKHDHPYDLPEITCTELDTTDNYGSWVYAEVNASIVASTQE